MTQGWGHRGGHRSDYFRSRPRTDVGREFHVSARGSGSRSRQEAGADERRIASDGPQASVGDYPYDDSNLDDKPYWLRMIKRGREFEVHLSADSLQWSRIGYERIVMAPDVLIGMAVDGGKEANAIVNYNVATFTNVRVLT